MTTSTQSDFLDRKLNVCFSHVDQNGDGGIEPADALALAARIIAYLGEPFDSKKAQAMLLSMENSWKRIMTVMDEDQNGLISPQEWRKGITQVFAADQASYAEGLRPVAEALFALCDKDGDGRVSREEFAGYQKAFGTSPENTRLAFERLDRDRSGFLSVEELISAWQEYYTSVDPDAPGNWLYGPIGAKATHGRGNN